MSFQNNLETILSKVEKYRDPEGGLVKGQIINDAYTIDPELITALISDDEIKAKFFVSIADHWVFNINLFVTYIQEKNFLDNSYTNFKNKIGLTGDDDQLIRQQKEVVLVWPFKDCVLEGGQDKEDQKRQEIFFNETLAQDEIDRLLDPKVITRWERHTVSGSEKVTTIKRDASGTVSENLLIKGNNLLALHSLKREFTGKVKLIYIDPPYYFGDKKQGDSFAYNSSFKLSTWLTFIKNRLDVARELLSEDGAIFVQMNDGGISELDLMMKEIFNQNGQNNFINKITVRTKSPSGFGTVNPGVFETAEYILAFAKNKPNWTYTPQYVESEYDKNYKYYVTNFDVPLEEWKIVDIYDYVAKLNGYQDTKDAEKKLHKLALLDLIAKFALDNSKFVFQSTAIGDKAGKETKKAKKISLENPDKVIKLEREKDYDIYLLNGRELAFYSKKVRVINQKSVPTVQLTNIWTDISYEGIANEGGITLKGGKKPEKLLQRIVEMASNEGDLVLDCFGGTGTSGAVAHKLNRKWILIEQLNYIKDMPEDRLKNVLNGDQTGISKSVNWQGGGDFIYCELAKYNEIYVDLIRDATTTEELWKVWLDMEQNAFLDYRIETHEVTDDGFKAMTFEVQQKLLMECLDKNQMYVNLTEIDDEDYKISDEDKDLNLQFYKNYDNR